jgi:tRNA threonylcarbamoyladenosine biosynthesis protein TsaE
MDARLALLLPAVTASAEETVRLGQQLGAALGAGVLVALYGDLGAGKTHLVKGLAAAFGVPPDEVRSPTFALVHAHDGADPATGDPVPVYHLDAYRLSGEDEMVDLGFEEYAYGEGACFLEWPERVEGLVPGDAVRLRLTHQGADRRRIERLPAGPPDDRAA